MFEWGEYTISKFRETVTITVVTEKTEVIDDEIAAEMFFSYYGKYTIGPKIHFGILCFHHLVWKGESAVTE